MLTTNQLFPKYGPNDFLFIEDATFIAPVTYTIGARYAYPVDDNTKNQWTPSTGTSLSATIDEVSPDDADYIQTVRSSTCIIELNGTIDPSTSANHVITYRAKNTGNGNLTIKLKQLDGTVIATRTNSTLTNVFTTYTITLSTLETDSITDYSGFFLELTSS